MKERINYWVQFYLNYSNFIELIINRIFGKKIKKIFLRNGLKIYGLSSSALSVVVDEIFLLNKYNPEHLKIRKGDIVVDIGANIGAFSLMAAHFGASKVFSYEPEINTFKMMKKNIEINHLRNIYIRNLALSDKNTKRKLFLRDEDGKNSLFKNSYEKGSKNFKIVKSINLENIFTNEKITKIDFLKIDCEGAEGLIIKSTPSYIWKQIDKISMEYHDMFSPMSHEEIISLLKKSGYEIESINYNDGFGYIYAYRI